MCTPCPYALCTQAVRSYMCAVAVLQPQAAAKAAAHVIHVPQVRPVADYEQTQQQALRDNPTYSTLDPTQATYLRYNDLTAKQTMTEVLTDYDMDEMDEACLAKIKAKVSPCTHTQTRTHAHCQAAESWTVAQPLGTRMHTRARTHIHTDWYTHRGYR